MWNSKRSDIFSGNGSSCGVLCEWVRWGVEKLPVAGFAQKKADFFLWGKF
jgi:hypothetical protein